MRGKQKRGRKRQSRPDNGVDQAIQSMQPHALYSMTLVGLTKDVEIGVTTAYLTVRRKQFAMLCGTRREQ